ncbi:DUF4129 domain-containing protein [Cryobacterium sp. Y11]|uniref:DUF4129 domain-containing protein n=1 Tax=Cryobacterium sp. Y11 TaxID=2045016 RepID=UPI000CE4DAC6|nr:DUF4129 domain-containing protein [Cryobacterium sp. Y11]
MTAAWVLLLGAVEVPVDPDAPDARSWLREELAKAPYAAARPTWFDRASQAFLDWLQSLTLPGDGGANWLPVLATLVVVAALLASWLVFGAPRLARRRRAGSALFGAVDQRSSAEMRTAASHAASTGQWSLACEEIFRAVARGLAERTILTVSPGTTAHDFAARAGLAFPQAGTALSKAADTFDRVRYLERAGTEAEYRALAALDAELRADAPVTLAPLAGTL